MLVALCCSGCGPRRGEEALAGRNLQLVSETQGKRKSILMLDDAVDKAMLKDDYITAESKYREIIKLEGDSPIRQLGLGNILYEEGKNEAARLAYRRYIDFAGADIHDHLLLTRYGDLANDAGDQVNARKAYALTITIMKDKYFFRLPDYPDNTPLRTLQATAIASNAMFYRGRIGKYLGESMRALSVDQNSNVARFTHADALYGIGKWADSKKEFDVALSLSPHAQAELIRKTIDQNYGFDQVDHSTTAVVHLDGTVTFSTQKTTIPNNIRMNGGTNPAQPVHSHVP